MWEIHTYGNGALLAMLFNGMRMWIASPEATALVHVIGVAGILFLAFGFLFTYEFRFLHWLGMDHYKTRTWRGWHHHMTLTFLSHHFLMRLRLRLKKNDSTDPIAKQNPDTERAGVARTGLQPCA